MTGSMVVQYMAQPIYQILLGLNPMLFGLAMTIPRILEAFADPFMGAISDRHRSPHGRRTEGGWIRIRMKIKKSGIRKAESGKRKAED